MTTEYRTPDGKRAWYARTPLGLTQHLVLDALFTDQTVCGHPLHEWCNTGVRTPLGFTCRWCIRRVRKHGVQRTRPAPTAYPWYLVVGAVNAWKWLRNLAKRGG